GHLARADGAFARTHDIGWGCGGAACGGPHGAAGRGAAPAKSRRRNGNLFYMVLRRDGAADTGRGYSPRRHRRARRALALCRRPGACGGGRFGLATTVAAKIPDLVLGSSMPWRHGFRFSSAEACAYF